MAQLTEELQKVALNALATTLGKTESEIETILTGDAPADVDKLLTDRIKAIRREGSNEGKAALQKQAGKKMKDVFGIEPSADTIEGLLDAIKADYKAPTDPTSLTEEQVKSHPLFVTLEKDLRNKDADHQKALEKATSDASAAVELANLKNDAIQARIAFGAVIPEDKNVASAMDYLFLKDLEGVTVKTENGETTVWKDGKREQNEKAFPLTKDEFLKKTVEGRYTTQVSPQKNSTGLPPNAAQQQQQQGEKKFKGEWPKSQSEFDKIVDNYTTYSKEERQEVIDYWKDNKK